MMTDVCAGENASVEAQEMTVAYKITGSQYRSQFQRRFIRLAAISLAVIRLDSSALRA